MFYTNLHQFTTNLDCGEITLIMPAALGINTNSRSVPLSVIIHKLSDNLVKKIIRESAVNNNVVYYTKSTKKHKVSQSIANHQNLTSI